MAKPSCSTCCPACDIHSGLSEREVAIVLSLRLPRVVLGLLVGAMLALAGGCYQGAFRNPLADPYLLGAAAGAGLAVTAVIALRGSAMGEGTSRLPGRHADRGLRRRTDRGRPHLAARHGRPGPLHRRR